MHAGRALTARRRGNGTGLAGPVYDNAMYRLQLRIGFRTSCLSANETRFVVADRWLPTMSRESLRFTNAAQYLTSHDIRKILSLLNSAVS